MTATLGFLAVAAMVVTYALEARSRWFVLGFAVACAGAAAYAVAIRSRPFALAEAVWCIVALRRWWARGAGPPAAGRTASESRPEFTVRSASRHFRIRT